MSQFKTTHRFATKSISLGLPVNLMLGKAVKNFTELKKSLPNIAGVQRKYDGERSQVHYSDGQVKLFSRSFESQDQKYVALKDNLARELKQSKEIKNCVLDGQILLIEGKNKILSFQELIREKDRLKEGRRLKYVAFDVIMLNDESQIETPFKDRIALLGEKILKSESLQPIQTQFIELSQEGAQSKVEKLIRQAKKENTEGLFMKEENSLYDISGSRKSWVKVKYSLEEGSRGLGDTLDLVPIGAYNGKGRRKDFYGAFLLATYNSNLKKFEAICKIGTGFTDQFLQSSSQRLKKSKENTPPNKLVLNEKIDTPDQWLVPSEVWEVKSDQITKSSKYFLNGNSQRLGLSLRFPALVKLRPDKTVLMATTSEQVIGLSKCS